MAVLDYFDDGGRVELVEWLIGEMTADVKLFGVDGRPTLGVQIQIEVSDASGRFFSSGAGRCSHVLDADVRLGKQGWGATGRC